MIKPKNWRHLTEESHLVEKIAHELAISKLVAKILVNRGIKSVDAGKNFLLSSMDQLESPLKLSGMKVALQRIQKAIKEKECVVVYGDYDVDGITSTALVYEMLSRLGARAFYHIPQRLEEGYGLNSKAIESWASKGAKLVITVDCGITSNSEVALANQLGIDVIITDHHNPPEELPPALAIINPILDQGKAFHKLAGVGVAFKLAQAVHQSFKLPLYDGVVAGEYLDLVTLGTIADIVPLVGENRAIVKTGLKSLETTWRPGLKALIEVAGLWGKELTATDVGYQLAPRINAVGRIGNPYLALELLLTDDTEKSIQLAEILNWENTKRQQIEQDIIKEAEQMIKDQVDFDNQQVIVLASEKWHTGVIGIVASKIVDKYHLPTILIGIDAQQGKGSGRSIPNFDLYLALNATKEWLIKFGGHHQAAGLSLAPDRISGFRKAINQYAAQLLNEDNTAPEVKIDTEVGISELSLELVDDLERLAPYGYGNPRPVLAWKGAKVINWSKIGKEQNHLRATLGDDNINHTAIGFNFSSHEQLIAATKIVDIAFGVDKNTWQGREELQLIIKDLKPYYLQSDKLVISNDFKIFDKRRIKDRINYLQKFAGKANIIYVYHHLEKKALSEKFKEDQGWRYIIANSYSHLDKEAADKKITYDNIFYWQLPLHLEDLRSLSSLSLNYHLCYEVIPDEQQIRSKFPTREFIGQAYLILKDLLNDQETMLTFHQLFGCLFIKVGVDPEDGELLLRVLAELGLLSYKREQEAGLYKVKLLAVPDSKLDLNMSPTYLAMMELKEIYPYWASLWAFGAKHDIKAACFI